jgi:transposase
MPVLSIVPYFKFARVKVLSQTVHHEAESVLIHIRPDRRYRPLCHDCGSPAGTVHSKGYRRIIRDLPLAGTETWLQVGYRKVWCEECGGARVEQLSFADANKRITFRLAQYVYELCRIMTVEDVARHLDLNPKTVKSIDKIFLERQFGQSDYTGLHILAIDEIALKKGHNYMTVVLDYLTGRVVWMGEGRGKETLDLFFAGMTERQKAAIEAVAIDMWEPYINRIQHYCPHAKIVFDMFHVVQAFGRVIDEIRRGEYRNATRRDRRVIKGSRYLLLRNSENLSQEQRSRLTKLLGINTTLNAVYVLKDQLKVIYRYRRRPAAKRGLDDWCAMAKEIDHPELNRFVKRLRFFEYGILNHCDYSIGTSKLEGVNNKIKLIKRKAYGFHDDRYFALKVKQAFSGNEATNYLG